jgi:5'-methylthioadenosine phosphorylase
MSTEPVLGIIGGTGLYSIEGLKVLENKQIETPFGNPSAPLVIGEWGKEKVVFLPRHGVSHRLLPSEINYRANIWALKSVGVRRVISVSATGSLAQDIEPGDLALPHQYLDWTRGRRNSSFFGEGVVAHISTAEPTCPALAGQIVKAAGAATTKIHSKKTYACVEGPRLGTKAESFFLKNAGCDLVGMTNVPEVFLAREAQLCYCTIAVATDYDCWLEDPEQHATVDKVITLYKQNLNRVQSILKKVIDLPMSDTPCGCGKALSGAVMTPEDVLNPAEKRLLEFLRS